MWLWGNDSVWQLVPMSDSPTSPKPQSLQPDIIWSPNHSSVEHLKWRKKSLSLFYMLQSDGIPECGYFSFQQAQTCSSLWHAALREHRLCKCVCVWVCEWKPPLTMVWHEMSCVFRALHSCLIVSQSTAGRIIAMIRRRPFVQTRESSLFSSFGRGGGEEK